MICISATKPSQNNTINCRTLTLLILFLSCHSERIEYWSVREIQHDVGYKKVEVYWVCRKRQYSCYSSRTMTWISVHGQREKISSSVTFYFLCTQKHSAEYAIALYGHGKCESVSTISFTLAGERSTLSNWRKSNEINRTNRQATRTTEILSKFFTWSFKWKVLANFETERHSALNRPGRNGLCTFWLVADYFIAPLIIWIQLNNWNLSKSVYVLWKNAGRVCLLSEFSLKSHSAAVSTRAHTTNGYAKWNVSEFVAVSKCFSHFVCNFQMPLRSWLRMIALLPNPKIRLLNYSKNRSRKVASVYMVAGSFDRENCGKSSVLACVPHCIAIQCRSCIKCLSLALKCDWPKTQISEHVAFD